MRKAFASGLLAILLLSGGAVLLSACNTVAGFGQDVTAAGQAVGNSAEKVKNGL
jgi:entericidin B